MRSDITNELLHFKSIAAMDLDEGKKDEYVKKRGSVINRMIANAKIKEDDLKFSYMKEGEFHFFRVVRKANIIQSALPNEEIVYINRSWNEYGI